MRPFVVSMLVKLQTSSTLYTGPRVVTGSPLSFADSFYSKEAIDKMKRLKRVSAPADYDAQSDPSKPTSVSLNFRKLRQELEADGWFERKWYGITRMVEVEEWREREEEERRWIKERKGYM